MATDRHQVSLWMHEDEYRRLRIWADKQRRKTSTAARVIIMERLDADGIPAVELAETPEGSGQR